MNCLNKNELNKGTKGQFEGTITTLEMTYKKKLDQCIDNLKKINPFEQYEFIVDENEDYNFIDLEKKYSLNNINKLKLNSSKSLENEITDMKKSFNQEPLEYKEVLFTDKINEKKNVILGNIKEVNVWPDTISFEDSNNEIVNDVPEYCDEIENQSDSLNNESLNDSNSQEFCEIENIDSSLKDANFDIFSFSNLKNFKAEENEENFEKENKSIIKEKDIAKNNLLLKNSNLFNKINTRNNFDFIDPVFATKDHLKKYKNATYEKIIFTTDCTSTIGDILLKDNKYSDIFREFSKSRNKISTPEQLAEYLMRSNLLFKNSNFYENNENIDDL